MASNCSVCNEVIDPILAPATAHPMCAVTFAEPDGMAPSARSIRNELIDIIRWADAGSPRSIQRNIGPSEIGSPCDRRIGYRLAEVPAVNTIHDPWAAIVGTAVHAWLEKALKAYIRQAPAQEWLTEQKLQVDQFVFGHSDLYHIPTATVIDYKTAGPDAMKHYVKDGPGQDYVIQVNLYGMGYENLGWPVRNVMLLFLPRAGWLKDAHPWIDAYRPEIAQAALDRMYSIGAGVAALGLPAADQNWERVPAVPTNNCGFCSWYNPRKESGASNTGCPGR